MKFLFGFLVIIFVIISFIFTLVRVVMGLLLQTAVSTGSKSGDRLVQKLRARVDAMTQKLVAWDSEMLPLLSANRSESKRPGLFSTQNSGIFTSVYQEPIVAFSGEKIGGNGIYLAKTSHREFIFRLKPKETEIWADGQPFGVLTGGVLLAAGRNPRQLARVEMEPGLKEWQLDIADRPAATLLNPAKTDSPLPRAVLPLRDLSLEEETIVLAVSVLNLVRPK